MSQLKYTNHIAHYQADAEINDYFEHDAFESQNIRRRYQALMHLHRPKKTDRVLEIGSGGGPALQILQKKNFHYFPLDIPRKNLSRIKKESALPLFPAAGDVYRLPFADGCFDCVLMSEVLEHLDEAVPALKEIYRVLKKEGLLLISVPYKERIMKTVCVHCNRLTPFNAHFHSFDENKLRNFMEQAGFTMGKWLSMNNKIADRLHFNRIVRALPFGLWRFFDRLINRLIPNKATHLVSLSFKQTSINKE